MALIQCPECRGNVSDLAPSCPHCGRPLTGASSDQSKYAVAMLNAGHVRDETVECLCRIDYLSRDDARKLIAAAPVVLTRNLNRKLAGEYASTLSKFCSVKVVADEHAETIEDVLQAEEAIFPPSHHPTPVPLTFGQTMGAVFLGCLLFGLLNFIITLTLG